MSLSEMILQSNVKNLKFCRIEIEQKLNGQFQVRVFHTPDNNIYLEMVYNRIVFRK